MKFSLLAATFAVAFSGIAAAQAAEPRPDPAQVAVQPSAAAGTTEQGSFSAFKANINPAVTVQTTGPYDQEDQFVGRKGFPLGGWKEIANPPS
ncbi:MAG TPA: hypothetical protein VKV32_14585 [Stellaceae bacterium]|nr:hypothetical protein [Stellaceae bacterium]